MEINVMQLSTDLKNGKYHKVAFTGHRPEKIGGYDRNNETRKMIRRKLREVCDYLILHCETTEFIEGMAQGVDQDAGDVILSIIDQMKREGNGSQYVFLNAAIPYPGQESVWPWSAQNRYYEQYDQIVDQGYRYDDDEEGFIHSIHSVRPKTKSMAIDWLDERNHYMVDWCDLLIAVWDGTAGGTKNCIDYAKSVGKPILLLKLNNNVEVKPMSTTEELKKVTIYTDGACSGNPGPGGYAAILIYNGVEKEITGGEVKTTNNRMELMAVLAGLHALKGKCEVELYSDSKYVIDALDKGWAESWRKNGWRKADKKPALNSDLWDLVLAYTDIHKVSAHWVEGHSTSEYNIRCDKLAVAEANKRK